MTRYLVCALVGLVLAAPPASAQQGPRRATLKKVDPAKGTVTLTVDGKERTFTVTDQTMLRDAAGRPVEERLKDKRLKEGAPVFFLARERDGTETLIGMKLVGSAGPSPRRGGNIQVGKIKKIDLDKKLLTLTVRGKEQTFALTDQTQVLGASGKDLAEKLKDFKEGAAVQFLARKQDGKEVLAGIKLGDGRPEPPPRFDSSKVKPLTELGTGKYQGYPGGLYPEGKNERPAAHEAAGRALARQVRPLDADGKPSPDGKIVLLSVGMSNTAQVSQGFQRALADYAGKNPKLVFINGAQGGMTAKAIQDPDDNGPGTRYWTTVDQRLKAAGLTRAQVQAVWIKQADAGPTQGFPKYAQTLQQELGNIVRVLAKRFPNLKLVYLSSRTYGGYARTRLNPEPYAYESGFSVKWLIEQQLKGDPSLNFDAKKGAVKAPWLSWGPYLWANGTTRRGDGYYYDESDYGSDGTHLSSSGVMKTGKLMLEFFKTDSTTRPWFNRK